MAKVFIVIGMNDAIQRVGPVGIARTVAERDKIMREQAPICDHMKWFEMEFEEDKAR